MNDRIPLHSDAQRAAWSAPMALTGLYCFALMAPHSPPGTNLGMLLVLIASVREAPILWRDLRSKILFWFVLVLTLYFALRTVFALIESPELDATINPHWSHYLRMTGLIALPMGWWLYRYQRHVAPLLISYGCGLVVGVLYQGNWDQILNADLSSRYVWGYSPNYLGMVAGSAVLASLAWMMFPLRGVIVRPSLFAGGGILVFASVLTYTSQSRSGWFGLVVGVVALIAILIGASGTSRKQAVILIVLIALSVITLLTFDGGTILYERIKVEWDTISSVASGNLENAANSNDSVGFRIDMWIAGAEAFFEKPLFGLGPGSGALVLKDQFTDVSFRHFHNLYVEILVSFGVIGALLLGLTSYHFLKPVVVAYRRGSIPDALAVGILIIALQVASTLFFAIRIGQTEGRAALTLLAAYCAYVLFLGDRRDSNAR